MSDEEKQEAIKNKINSINMLLQKRWISEEQKTKLRKQHKELVKKLKS